MSVYNSLQLPCGAARAEPRRGTGARLGPFPPPREVPAGGRGPRRGGSGAQAAAGGRGGGARGEDAPWDCGPRNPAEPKSGARRAEEGRPGNRAARARPRAAEDAVHSGNREPCGAALGRGPVQTLGLSCGQTAACRNSVPLPGPLLAQPALRESERPQLQGAAGPTPGGQTRTLTASAKRRAGGGGLPPTGLLSRASSPKATWPGPCFPVPFEATVTSLS